MNNYHWSGNSSLNFRLNSTSSWVEYTPLHLLPIRSNNSWATCSIDFAVFGNFSGLTGGSDFVTTLGCWWTVCVFLIAPAFPFAKFCFVWLLLNPNALCSLVWDCIVRFGSDGLVKLTFGWPFELSWTFLMLLDCWWLCWDLEKFMRIWPLKFWTLLCIGILLFEVMRDGAVILVLRIPIWLPFWRARSLGGKLGSDRTTNGFLGPDLGPATGLVFGFLN